MKKLWLLLPLILWGCGGGSDTPTPPPEPQTCSVYITWDAPYMYLDGLPLSPDTFEKFTVYVAEAPGQSQYDLIMVIDIFDAASVTAVRVDGLPYRASYIYMTVTDQKDMTSPLSPEWVWDCVTGHLYEG